MRDRKDKEENANSRRRLYIMVNDCEGRRRIIEKEVVKDRQQWNRLTSTSSECVKYYADNPVFISCT